MKKALLLLVLLSILLVSCIRIGNISPAGNVPGKAPDAKGGMAQTPTGEMQSLPFGQPGNPGDQSGSAPISQSGSTSSSPSSPGIRMDEIQGLQGGSQTSDIGVLPLSGQDGNPPVGSGMAGFKEGLPGQDNNAAKLPVFDSNWDLSRDSHTINVGEAVVLSWRVSNADSLTLDVGGAGVTTDLGRGPVINVPPDRVAAIVVPDLIGKYKFVLTARNSYGFTARSTEVQVVLPGQRQENLGYDRIRTFMVYPEKVKKGDIVHVYWNVSDADHVYLEDDITGSYSWPANERDRVPAYGERYFYPFQYTNFILKFGKGENMVFSPFPKPGMQLNPDYGRSSIVVFVE